MNSVTNEFMVRRASAEDLKFPIRFAVQNSWRPFGPGDLSSAYSFDPSGFFVGELDGEIITHIMAIKYPGHSTHIGSFMVDKEHRGKRYGEKTWDFAWKTLDHTCTIGLDALSYMIPKFETYGFRTVWENSIALLSFENIINIFGSFDLPSGFSIKPIRMVDFEKLVKYDASVFGTLRYKLVEAWIKIPGSLGWAALDGNGNIIGYTMVRPIILDGGTELGLNMAPLYAENDQVASALLKVAAETCIGNEAISATKFLLIHAHDGEHGQHASQLFAQVEAKYIPFATRMYTKGIPQCIQLTKIYGITHPTFD